MSKSRAFFKVSQKLVRLLRFLKNSCVFRGFWKTRASFEVSEKLVRFSRFLKNSKVSKIRASFEVSGEPGQHDAWGFKMASETIHTSLVIKGYCFSATISHEIIYLKNKHNVEIFLLLSVSHGGVFCSEYRSRFCSPKTGEEESKLLQWSILHSTVYKTKWAIDFHEWQINRKVKVPVLDAGGTFKDYGDM